MKIISSKGLKDYYDFLQGIYGIDEKLILDRTEMSKDKRTPKEFDMIRLYVCGYVIEGMFKDNDWRYGLELEKYHTDKYYYSDRHNKNDYYNVVADYDRTVKILKQPIKITDDSKNPNLILDCPILYHVLSSYYFDSYKYIDKKEILDLIKFPILKDYKVNKVFSAEQIWLMLSEFLGREKNKIVNTQTDKEKIIGFGFDYKTSFRKM